MTQELLPCPFCRYAAKSWRQGIIRKLLVACSNGDCGAAFTKFTPKEWNTRATIKPSDNPEWKKGIIDNIINGHKEKYDEPSDKAAALEKSVYHHSEFDNDGNEIKRVYWIAPPDFETIRAALQQPDNLCTKCNCAINEKSGC